MKHSKHIAQEDLWAAHLRHGQDFAWMLDIHDEWQIECRPELAEVAGKIFVDSFRKAGERLRIQVPLTGEFKVGNNWADCH